MRRAESKAQLKMLPAKTMCAIEMGKRKIHIDGLGDISDYAVLPE